MTDLFQYGDEIAAEDGPAPFTQVPDWVLLSGCTAQAFRMYVFLAAHIDPRDPLAKVPCPKQTAIAKAMGLSNEKQVGPYGHELQRLGAIRMEKYRYASGMRNGYRYRVRFNPPENYTGPIRMKDFYLANPELRFDAAAGRLRVAATPPADGGTENSTPGGTKNSTLGGAEKSTLRGTTDSTLQGPTDGTPQGAADGTPQGTMWNQLEGAAYGPLQPPVDRSAKEDQGEADQEEAENPPPPPSVTTAEDARGRTSEEGAASPHDPSPEAAAGPDGASPDDGSSWRTDAPTAVEARHVAMARDVLARLPRWLAPGDQVERTMALEVISAVIARGYTPGLVTAELTANPVEHVANKPAFIAARLRRMSPPIPPQRPADRATVDEINARKAAQAGTPPPATAAQARAEMEAARRRRLQQGGGEA